MLTPNDELFLEIEAGNLQRAGTPMPLIIDIINNMAAKLSCDAACQKKKEADKLRKKWIDSINQYEKLPQTIATNEEKYYDVAKGKGYYTNDILKPKYEKEAQNLVTEEHNYLKETTTKFNVLLDGFSGETIAVQRLKELENDLIIKNKLLKERIDDHYKTTLTDERRVFYEIEEVDRLNKYAYILKVVYFILIGLYVFFGPFFRKDYYKSAKHWFRLLIYMIIPYIIKPIVIFLTTEQPRSNNDLDIKENIKKAGAFTKDILYSYPSTLVTELT